MKINLDYYNGKDVYSDGEIEKEIINYLKTETNYEKVFEKDTRFPVVYHLSSIRGNILNWYPFKKNASVLEIGAGMGAITPVLCDKVGRVVAVELSRQRASAIEERCKDKENLELIVGNLNDIEFKEKFDYITLIGVLEYAQLYTNSKNPYETFLSNIKKLLKKDGKLLIAIENKFGMKYFSGMPEDHTGIRYDSIVGYRNKSGVKTFGKNDITELLKKVGLTETKFYYPLPDYKLPNVIFTDEYLPTENNINRNLQYYNKEDVLNFEETHVYKEIIKEDTSLFTKFANSFFVEASQEVIENDIKGVFFNNWRKEKYQLKTIMTDKEVTKYAISKNSNMHIQNMKQILEKMNEQKILTIDYYENNTIVSQLMEQHNYEEYLTKLYQSNKDIDELCEGIKKFYTNLKEILKISENTEETIFEKYNIMCSEEMKQNFNFVEDGFFDLRFANCFYKNDEFYFYDQEWIEKNVPIEFIIYRSINDCNEFNCKEKQKIYEFLNINNYIEIFRELENKVVDDKKNISLCKIFDKPYMIENVLVEHRGLIEENSVLQRKILEENEKFENLNRGYYELINSRAFKLVNKIRKVVIILRKCKNKLKL